MRQDELVLKFPLPSMYLSANRTANVPYMRVAALKREYISLCKPIIGLALLDADWTVPALAVVSTRWCVKGAHRGEKRKDKCYAPRDCGNAVFAFKAGYDALKGSVIVDDDYTHMRLGQVDIDRKSGPFVVVTVTPLD